MVEWFQSEKGGLSLCYYLAIDIGASSGRHIVGWQENGGVRTREVFRFPNGVQEENGHLTWDVRELFSNVVMGIMEAFKQYPKIESMSIDTWGVDYVLLKGDKEVYPVYAYRDSRTEAVIPQVHEILPFPELYCRTGCQFQPFNSIYQLYADKLDSMLIPAFSMLIKQGTACAVEGDIKVAMAMSILKTISGTGQLSEMYSIDFDKDICIIGHSGSGDADFSQAKKPTMKIVPVFHGKTGGGYLTQFYPPVGPVTYLGITQDKDGHFKFVVAEGVNEEGPIFTFGDTNMRTRFTCGAREFCNRWSEAGPTHHMAAAVGRHIDRRG